LVLDSTRGDILGTDTNSINGGASAAIGKYHSGQIDVALEHDKYYSQDFE
jgi:hypothetical protein